LQAQTSTETQLDFKDMFNIYHGGYIFLFLVKMGEERNLKHKLILGQQQLPKADQITRLW
jgi:hypothetical protein